MRIVPLTGTFLFVGEVVKQVGSGNAFPISASDAWVLLFSLMGAAITSWSVARTKAGDTPIKIDRLAAETALGAMAGICLQLLIKELRPIGLNGSIGLSILGAAFGMRTFVLILRGFQALARIRGVKINLDDGQNQEGDDDAQK